MTAITNTVQFPIPNREKYLDIKQQGLLWQDITDINNHIFYKQKHKGNWKNVFRRLSVP